MNQNSSTSPGKILIIDDSDTALAAAQRALESAGYEVLTSTSALKMPSIVQREHPDLILLDIEMPALRGDQVMEFTNLFDFLRRCPIVFHSGKSEEVLQELVQKTGASGYIKKTADTASFLAQVRKWIPAKTENGVAR